MKADLYHRQLFSNLKGRGETVAIVGKVHKVYPEERRLLIECDPENKSIATVLIPENQPVQQFKEVVYIEVRGKCVNPREVQMEEWTNFLANFDLKSYNTMLGYATKEFKDLFI